MAPENEIKEALLGHKGLIYEPSSNTIYGILHLPDGDNYEIEIDLKPYPRFFPSVKETGGRIPLKGGKTMFMNLQEIVVLRLLPDPKFF